MLLNLVSYNANKTFRIQIVSKLVPSDTYIIYYKSKIIYIRLNFVKLCLFEVMIKSQYRLCTNLNSSLYTTKLRHFLAKNLDAFNLRLYGLSIQILNF